LGGSDLARGQLESSPFFLQTMTVRRRTAVDRPGFYERIRYDKAGLAGGVARQDEDCELLGERMGWEPFVRRYDENDTPAWRKRKVRWPTARSPSASSAPRRQPRRSP